MQHEVQILYAQNSAEATAARNQGYEPVECAFGRESIMGRLQLDHHGSYSHLEAVSVRAARYAGRGKLHDKFVVTGTPDHDQIYAIATLSGNINPEEEEAQAIAEMDTDPVGLDPLSPRYQKDLLFRQRTQGIEKSEKGAHNALEILIDIYTREQTQEEIEKAITQEKDRQARINSYVQDCVPGIILFAVGPERGHEWYRRAPIIMHYNLQSKSIMLGLCPKRGAPFTEKSGYEILGASGLEVLYPLLDQALNQRGSGGRPEVGGSPRNIKVTEEEARAAYESIKRYLQGGNHEPRAKTGMGI